MNDKKNKPGQGRKSPIQSKSPLQRISTRISVEAIAILSEQDNKAAYIDEAIKDKAYSGNLCEHEFAPCEITGQFITNGGYSGTMKAKCTKCGYMP